MIHESFKIDENSILNQDENSILNQDENSILNQDENSILNQDENSILNQDQELEEETVKLFEDKFSGLAETFWRNRCFGIRHE